MRRLAMSGTLNPEPRNCVALSLKPLRREAPIHLLMPDFSETPGSAGLPET